MEDNILKNSEDKIGEQYPAIGRWLEAMKFPPKNNMVRHSFIREFVFKNFDISEFCAKFDGFLKASDGRIKNQPFELYQEFIIKNFVKEKKLLNGKLIEEGSLPEKVCHYLSHYKIYLISGGDVARGIAERHNLKKERIFRLMIENKLTSDDISHWKGKLKGESDIIWFTKSDSIPREFSGCSDDSVAAEKIRDLLGLAHLFNCGLIEVKIPKEIVENGSSIPTICAVAGYPYFRPAKRTDGFGRAIDLDKKTTGLPEAVHDQIDWNKNFKLRYVGDLPMEKIEYSDLEWEQVTTVSETDLVAFIKGVNREA